MRIWEDYMETIFVTESREMLFTGTEDIDVRPLHSSELHYEGDSREEALRARLSTGITPFSCICANEMPFATQKPWRVCSK